MKLGGLNKCSMIDFPGNVSAVVFTRGCNMVCPYCHNALLVKLGEATGDVTEEDVFELLNKRKGLLDAVVISGGEPCIHKGLVPFARKIKQLGYRLKLDSNGTRPEILRALLDETLLDYIAMDIKTIPEDYHIIMSQPVDPSAIASSIRLIKESGVAHEFRTTCVYPFIDDTKLERILDLVSGADLYALQHCKTTSDSIDVLNPDFFDNDHYAHTKKEVERLCTIAEKRVKRCVVR
jgi:pyruvate formate lyase activating enzyme